jgi:hypothetical protein
MWTNATLSREVSMWSPPASPQASSVTISPLSNSPEWLDSASSRLRELRSLRENWDGYGSPRISGDALNSAVALLSAVQREGLGVPNIAPVTGGGIGLEWKSGSRTVEFEILPDGAIETLLIERRRGLSDHMEEGTLSVARIYESHYLIEWLLGAQ